MFITTKQFDWASIYAKDYNVTCKNIVKPESKSSRLALAMSIQKDAVTSAELYRLDIIKPDRLKTLIRDGRIVPLGKDKLSHIVRTADIVAYYAGLVTDNGYRTKEVAAMAGCTAEYVSELCANGKLKSWKQGTVLVVDRGDGDRFVATYRQKHATPKPSQDRAS